MSKFTILVSNRTGSARMHGTAKQIARVMAFLAKHERDTLTLRDSLLTPSKEEK